MKRLLVTLITILAVAVPTFAQQPAITVPQGGTGLNNVPSGALLSGDSQLRLKATSSPTVNYITASSTTNASRFPLLNFNSASGTSLSLGNLLQINGAGTSSVTGGLTLNHLNTGNVTASGLISCDTIDTDSQGNFMCGADSTGAGGSITGSGNAGEIAVFDGAASILGYSGFTFTTATNLFSTVNATTTSLSVANLLNVAGTGTSTFAGGITHGYLSGTGAAFSNILAVSGTGTSTFTGSLSSNRLTVTNDIAVGNLITIAGTGTSTNAGSEAITGHLRVGSLEILGSCKGCPSGGGTAAGAGGDVQYNDGSNGFAAEAALNYSASTDKLTMVNASSTAISIANLLNVAGTGTSTFAGGVTGGHLSVSGLAVGNLLTVSGTGTSTFAGGVTSGLLSTGVGVQITGGSFQSAVALNVTHSSTSTFTGGLSMGGITTTNGLAVTSGILNASGVLVRAGTLGVGTTSPSQDFGVANSALIAGGLTVGTEATTTAGSASISNFLSVGDPDSTATSTHRIGNRNTTRGGALELEFNDGSGRTLLCWPKDTGGVGSLACAIK